MKIRLTAALLAELALAAPMLSGCLLEEQGAYAVAPPAPPDEGEDPSFAALPPYPEEPGPPALPLPSSPPPARVRPPPPPLRAELPPPPPLRVAPRAQPAPAPRCSGSCGCMTYDEAVADFVRRAEDHVRRFFRAFAARRDHAAMDAFIREGIRRAERHGIINERDVVKFIDVWIVRGDGFEQEPWAARILADRRLTPTRKAEALFRAAVEP